MTRPDTAPPRRGLAEKRAAITRGALTVFARDGYTRASIDAIAAEAGVSTRTIYNHFRDKSALFHAVIQESAAEVVEAQVAIMDRHLHRVTDLEADLIAFGKDWAAPLTDYVDHFALVRQINAEVGHIPQDTLDAWQETGPLRVRRELAKRLQRLADQGLLRIGNADRAAVHFTLLVAREVASRSYFGVVAIPEAEVDEIATAGVLAFLHGYLP